MELFKYIIKLFSAKKALTGSDKLEVIQESNIIKFKIRNNFNAYYITFNFNTGRFITAVRYEIGKMLKEVNHVKISESEFISALNSI